MNVKRIWVTAMASVLVACGGGGGGGAGSGFAGIGGTGTGTVSGFASVIVNDDKELLTGDDTRFTIDGVTVSRSEFERTEHRGLVIRFEVEDDSDDDGLATASAVTIAAFNQAKGPVTSTAPLAVLGQPVVVTGETFLDDVPGNDPANLAIGDVVEVAGFTDGNGVIQASRIEFKPAGLLEWKLRGRVAAAPAPNAAGFFIGAQQVLLGGVSPRDCSGGVGTGDLVEVKAAQDPGFTPGAALDTVTEVECQADGLSASDPAATVIDASFEGYVTEADLGDGAFAIGDQVVVVDAATEFEGGAIADLVPGVKVEVEGRFDTGSGILTADEVEFRQRRVRIIAPLAPGDVTPGVALEVLGIAVVGMPQTEDDDGVLAGGVGSSTQIEVRGFADAAGTVFAEEVRERGPGDPTEVRLRGPASNIVNGVSFQVLGVTVNVATARELEDGDSTPLTVGAFFAALGVGTIVDVDDATYSAGSNTLDFAKIEIED